MGTRARRALPVYVCARVCVCGGVSERVPRSCVVWCGAVLTCAAPSALTRVFVKG